MVVAVDPVLGANEGEVAFDEYKYISKKLKK